MGQGAGAIARRHPFAGWVILSLLAVGCVSPSLDVGAAPDPASFSWLWEQGFEAASYDAAKASANGWQYQLLQPDAERASLQVVPTPVHGGNFALHAVVPDRVSGDPSSKAMIGIKASAGGAPFAFTRGTSLVVSAWYRLHANGANIYVMDLEDSAEGNEGLRLYVSNDGTVVLNRDKLGLTPNLIGDEAGAKAPFDTWFHLEVALDLGEEGSARSRVWVDEALSFDSDAANITPSVASYDTVQLGYTVSQVAGELWTDDLAIGVGPWR